MTVRKSGSRQTRHALAVVLYASALALLPGAVAEARCSPEQMRAELAQGTWSSGVAAFYDLWGGGCAWTDEAATALHAALTHIDAHGLPPYLFRADEIGRELRPPPGAAAANRDLLLTTEALRYANIMRGGHVDIAELYGDVAIRRWSADPAPELAAALRSGHLAHWLDNLPPAAPEYQRLKAALAQYREMERRGGWPTFDLPPGKRSLKPDETGAFMPKLRARLQLAGDLQRAGEGDLYDAAMVEAVRRFQSRHGLAVDGVVGRDTLAALNVPVAQRIAQIALNMERWRYMAPAMPPTRIEVNVPAAEAMVIADGATDFRMKTIVGRKSTPTPLLVSAIERVVINPPWVVPFSIYRRDIAPAIARDPDYLQKHEMSWQDGQLVQQPGPENALGRLKFDLQSPFAVFLHDTNAPGLFASDNRFRSSGCIRVEKPMELAVYLLASTDWSRERIEDLIHAGATVPLRVEPPLPVILAYWTAFVEADGLVQFRDDIYGRDHALSATLGGMTLPPLAISEARECGS